MPGPWCEQLLHTLDAIPFPVVVLDGDLTTYRAANPAFCTLFELARDQVVGHGSQEFGLFVDRADREAIVAELRTTRTAARREARLRTASGREIVALLDGTFATLGGRQVLVVAFIEVTARVIAEREARETAARLAKSERAFRDVMETMHEVFWLRDPATGAIEYVSPAYERVFGRSCASLVREPDSWLETVVADERERVERAATPARQLAGEYDETYRIQLPGGAIRVIHARAFPTRPEPGAPARIAGVAEDITARVELEEQLRQTQKLESLGLLAGGVAHDFNNLLAVIGACSNMLQEAGSASGDARELVDEIDHAVTRATTLTRQLLAFSRRETARPVVLDLNEAIEQTRRMVRRMVGEHIALASSLCPELARVRMDPGHVVQVVMNLVVNARDAMPAGGKLEIATRNAPATGEIVLSIADTGTGIPADVLPRIFDPFFTTKDAGRGTGMGLAVVRGIVAQAGGRIEVDTEPGRGTTFHVHLPAVAEEAAGARQSTRIPTIRGSERVIVVDDDAHIRQSTARALRTRGYTVHEAADAHAALAQLAADPRIELLVTDVVMPELDGPELAARARGLAPDLRVLFISGYTDDGVVRHGAIASGADLLEKPFRLEALARRVRKVLDRRAESAR